MISINDGRIYYDESHLFDEKITDIAGILHRYRNYQINLFLHIVSDPSCGYEKGVGSGRIPPAISGLTAKDRFTSLLKSRKITAGAKGFYTNKLKPKVDFPNEIKSVSFAYCSYRDIPKHFAARESQYGIVFFHDFLQSKGMVPVRYINDEDDESIRKLVFNEAFALEAYGNRYDMRWEKEWRINRDLEFQDEDIAFIIIPDAEYDEFLGCDAIGEYVILPSSVFLNSFEYFIIAHKMEHHSWGQIALWGEWKVDFRMFPKFTPDDKALFVKNYGEHLETLVKAEIQDVYEARYIARFMNFAGTLNPAFLGKTSFKDIQSVKDNNYGDSHRKKRLIIDFRCLMYSFIRYPFSSSASMWSFRSVIGVKYSNIGLLRTKEYCTVHSESSKRMEGCYCYRIAASVSRTTICCWKNWDAFSSRTAYIRPLQSG